MRPEGYVHHVNLACSESADCLWWHDISVVTSPGVGNAAKAGGCLCASDRFHSTYAPRARDANVARDTSPLEISAYTYTVWTSSQRTLSANFEHSLIKLVFVSSRQWDWLVSKLNTDQNPKRLDGSPNKSFSTQLVCRYSKIYWWHSKHTKITYHLKF